MKKTILASILLVVCASSFSGLVDLPKERVALPIVEGSHLICVWDDAAGDWINDFEDYDHTGMYDFNVPEWGTWYWVGLWDEATGDYVVGKWIGHFLTD